MALSFLPPGDKGTARAADDGIADEGVATLCDIADERPRRRLRHLH